MPPTAQRKLSAPHAYTPHATQRMESLAGLPLASFKARAAAFLMDMVLVLLAYIPVMVVIRWLAAGRNWHASIDVKWDFHELSSVIFLILYFGLTLFWGNGRTLGKRLVGIRVVDCGRTHDFPQPTITFRRNANRRIAAS